MAFEKVTIKYNGEYYQWPVSELDLPSGDVTDDQIRLAVVQALSAEGVIVSDLNNFVVDPLESERLNGEHEDKTDLNVRPSATYG